MENPKVPRGIQAMSDVINEYERRIIGVGVIAMQSVSRELYEQAQSRIRELEARIRELEAEREQFSKAYGLLVVERDAAQRQAAEAHEQIDGLRTRLLQKQSDYVAAERQAAESQALLKHASTVMREVSKNALEDWICKSGLDMADEIDRSSRSALTAAIKAARAEELEELAAWISAQRNSIPATGEEFAAAVRARGAK